MKEPPKRLRWFRFRLRTLFVLVTLVCVLCGYLGWAMNWKWQREKFFMNRIVPTAATKDIPIWSGKEQAPTVLRLLGADGYWTIPVKASDVHEARRLFPESQIYVTELDEQH